MKVLIIGEYYSSNLGDGVICECVKKLLEHHYEKIEIIWADISGRRYYELIGNQDSSLKKAKYTAFKLKISDVLTGLGIDTEYVRFKRVFAKKKTIIDEIGSQYYDVALFAGGQMFRDTFVLSIQKFIGNLNKNNVPVIFNACGVGEIKSKKMRNLLSQALCSNNVVAISSRDDIDTIHEILLKNKDIKPIVTYDPAIWSKDVYNISRKESDVIGLGIMYAYNHEHQEMVNFWMRIIKELNNRGIKWQVFCNGTEKDGQFAKYILENMGYSSEKIRRLIAPRPITPKQLVETISTFKGIISFRLHSHIIAYSLDIPGISIVWDEKLRFFFRSIEAENRCKSIKTDASEIIDELELAQAEGYNDKLRTYQKQQGYELLIRMIEQKI